MISVDIIPTSVYPEGQKGAAKRAESPEDRLVFYSEKKIVSNVNNTFCAAGIASNCFFSCRVGN